MMSAGMDVSGNPISGNHLYMAIVIDMNDDVNKIIHRTGGDPHMSRVRNQRKQKKIMSQIFFDQKNFLVLCIKIERNKIIAEFINSNKNKKELQAELICIFNQRLFRLIRNKINDFLLQHHYELTDVYFECDSDCIGFAKDNGLSYTNTKSTHSIADAVAWGNRRNIELDGTISIDLTNEIRRSVREHIKM